MHNFWNQLIATLFREFFSTESTKVSVIPISYPKSAIPTRNRGRLYLWTDKNCGHKYLLFFLRRLGRSSSKANQSGLWFLTFIALISKLSTLVPLRPKQLLTSGPGVRVKLSCHIFEMFLKTASFFGASGFGLLVADFHFA